MKRLANMIKNLPENISLSKNEFLLTIACSALAGVVLGMILSPRRNMKNGCNKVINNNYGIDEFEDEFEDDDE